ncbi:MAG: hypothetical protein ACO3B0_09080, partial [Chitinophagaceae bacterium]
MSQIHSNSIHIIDGFIDSALLEEVNKIIVHADHGVNTSKASGEEKYRTLGFAEPKFDLITNYSPPSVILIPHEEFPIKKVFDPIMLQMHETIQRLWGRDLFL